MRRAFLLVALLVLTQPGCGALVGASIDAGFRELQDDGRHPVYRNKSYGAHFADALFEDDRPRGEVTVTVQTRRRR